MIKTFLLSLPLSFLSFFFFFFFFFFPFSLLLSSSLFFSFSFFFSFLCFFFKKKKLWRFQASRYRGSLCPHTKPICLEKMVTNNKQIQSLFSITLFLFLSLSLSSLSFSSLFPFLDKKENEKKNNFQK